MNDRVPTFMEYVRFVLEFYIGLIVMGLIAFVLFKAGHTAFGFLIMLLFFISAAVGYIRLCRRANKAIVNRVNPHARATLRSRLGRFILGLTIVCAVVLPFVFFGRYMLLGYIVLIAFAVMYAPLAKWRGWGTEGRITGYLHRPRFYDPSRRSANGSTSVVKSNL